MAKDSWSEHAQGRNNRIPKALTSKLDELDDALHRVRRQLPELCSDPAFVASVATELRMLLCNSSGTTGLLWRVADDLKVSDDLHLHVWKKANLDHPLAHGLVMAGCLFRRPDPSLEASWPISHVSFRHLISTYEALSSLSISYTHQALIKKLAEQVGSAHSDGGIEPGIKNAGKWRIGEVPFHARVLLGDCYVTLQIGERIIAAAEKQLGYTRARYSNPVSLLVRARLRELPLGRIPIGVFQSHIPEIGVQLNLTRTAMIFAIVKSGEPSIEFKAPLPPGWTTGQDSCFSLTYDHKCRQIRANSAHAAGDASDIDLGFWDMTESNATPNPESSQYLFHTQLSGYPRPMSSTDLLRVPPLPIPTIEMPDQ